jgi:hypothetical protein
MIVKDSLSPDYAGIVVKAGDGNSYPFFPIYRAYIGDNLIYPDCQNKQANHLILPYRITVRYNLIVDSRVNSYYGVYSGIVNDITRTITFETAFPSFVSTQTDFSDYKAMFNPSDRPFVNVSNALAINLASVVRGSLISRWSQGFRTQWWQEAIKRPNSSKIYPYLGRPSEADSIFIKDVATDIEKNYSAISEDTPPQIYTTETKDLYYYTPDIWREGSVYTKDKISQFLGIDETFVIIDNQRTLNNSSISIKIAGKPTEPYRGSDYSRFYEFSGDDGIIVRYDNKVYQLGENTVVIQCPVNQIPPTDIIISGSGTFRNYQYSKRHNYQYGYYSATSDSRILERIQANPDYVYYPFGEVLTHNESKASGRRPEQWIKGQLGYGYDGGLYNVWPEAWIKYSYPLIPLRSGNARDYCPGRIFSTSVYGHTPFYEIFNGEIIGIQYGGSDVKYTETYEILENNNPAYSSHSEWLADVTTPGHDPKPPTS